MKVRCECGHEFEVREDVVQTKCPRCGREFPVTPAEDWVQSIATDDLTLEKEPPSSPAREAAPKPAAKAPAMPVSVGREQAAAGRGPAAIRKRPSEPVTAAELPPAPVGLIALAKMVKNQPKACLPHFEAGISSRRFVVETGVVLLALALIGAFAQAWLEAPRQIPVGKALVNWLGVVCEAASGAALFSLLSVLLKRGGKPLGMCEAVAVSRVGSLLLMAPIAIIMAIITAVVLAGGHSPGVLPRVASYLPKLYLVAVFCAQMVVPAALLRLGCWPSVIVNVVAVFCTYSLSQKLTGAF